MALCVDYEELVQNLKRHGFELGYSTISSDAVIRKPYDFWHKGYSVIRVGYSGVAVNEITYANDKNYRCDSHLAVLSLLNKLKIQTSDWKPSILNTFSDVLFGTYDESITKYEKMLATFPKFSTNFQALFADELDALAVSSTAVQIKPDMSKVYKHAFENYCYIAAMTPECICFQDIGRNSSYTSVSYRELGNFTIDYEATADLQLLLCSSLHLMSKVIDLSRIGKTIKDFDSYVKAVESAHTSALEHIFLIKGSKFCVQISIREHSVTVELYKHDYFRGATCDTTPTVFAQVLNLDPAFSQKCTHDLLQKIIKTFSAVLVANPELRKALFESLYSFEDKLDNKETSVSANPESIRSLQATEIQKTDFASMALGISDSQGANADNSTTQAADLKRITIGGKGFYVVEGCTNEDATLCIAEEPWCDDVWGFNETSGKHILEVVDNNCNASCTYDWFGMLSDKIRSAIKSVNINTYEDDLSGSSEAQTCMFVPSRGEWEAVPFDVRRRIIKYKRAWTRSVPMQFGYEMYFVDCDGNFSSHNVGHHRYGIVPACYVNNVMITELLGNGEPAMMDF